MSPLFGVALQTLNREPNRCLSPEGKGLDERQVALARGLFPREKLGKLPRPRDQVRGLAFDQEEDDPRSPGGQATQHFFTREQLVGRHVGYRPWVDPRPGYATSFAATCLRVAVTG